MPKDPMKTASESPVRVSCVPAEDLYREPEWVATVYPDWTTLQLADGRVFAFNRGTGRAYKVPHPECPFAVYPDNAEMQRRASLETAMRPGDGQLFRSG